MFLDLVGMARKIERNMKRVSVPLLHCAVLLAVVFSSACTEGEGKDENAARQGSVPTITKSYTTDAEQPLDRLEVVHFTVDVEGLDPTEGVYWFYDVLEPGLFVDYASISPTPYHVQVTSDLRTHLLWHGYNTPDPSSTERHFSYDATVGLLPADEELCNGFSVYLNSTGVEAPTPEHSPMEPGGDVNGGDAESNKGRSSNPDAARNDSAPIGAEVAQLEALYQDASAIVGPGGEIYDPDFDFDDEPSYGPEGVLQSESPPVCVSVVPEPEVGKSILYPTTGFQRVGQLVEYQITLENLAPGSAENPNPYLFIEEIDDGFAFDSFHSNNEGLNQALQGWEDHLVWNEGKWRVEIPFSPGQGELGYLRPVVIVKARVREGAEGVLCNRAELRNPYEAAEEGFGDDDENGLGETYKFDTDSVCIDSRSAIEVSKEIDVYRAKNSYHDDAQSMEVDVAEYEDIVFLGKFYDRLKIYEEPIKISDDTFLGFDIWYHLYIKEGDAIADLEGGDEEFVLYDESRSPHCFDGNSWAFSCLANFALWMNEAEFFPQGGGHWAHSLRGDRHYLNVTGDTPKDAYDGNNATPEGQINSWNVALAVPADWIVEDMGVTHSALSGISILDLFSDAQFEVPDGTTIPLCNMVAIYDRHELLTGGGPEQVPPLFRELICVPIECEGRMHAQPRRTRLRRGARGVFSDGPVRFRSDHRGRDCRPARRPRRVSRKHRPRPCVQSRQQPLRVPLVRPRLHRSGRPRQFRELSGMPVRDGSRDSGQYFGCSAPRRRAAVLGKFRLRARCRRGLSLLR